DFYLVKTDANGDLLWSRTYGGTDPDVAYSVQQTTDGGYIIAGQTGFANGPVGEDVYLIKTDANGDTLWSKTFGGIDNDIGLSVQQTTDGGYIIAGITWSFGAVYEDIYLIKTDSLGNSGCNEGSTNTIVTTPATQVSSPVTVVGSAPFIVTSPATVVGSGGIVTTLCITTGINPISNFQLPISISPNPSSGIFTITFPENFPKGKIEIYNVMGEKMYSEAFNSKLQTVNSKLNPGIYFVKITGGEKQYVQKLVVE
ncbi:MAG: T9SS type A sorting domain-containing protein, partial [Bacteroidota bacterium]